MTKANKVVNKRFFILATEDQECFYPEVLQDGSSGYTEIWDTEKDALDSARSRVTALTADPVIVCELVPLRRVSRTSSTKKISSFDLAEDEE